MCGAIARAVTRPPFDSTVCSSSYAARHRSCRLEFLSYRLLYYLYSAAAADALITLAGMTREERADAGVAHALRVRAAAATGDYAAFFSLYRVAPALSASVMDLFAHRTRVAAAMRMAEA